MHKWTIFTLRRLSAVLELISFQPTKVRPLNILLRLRPREIFHRSRIQRRRIPHFCKWNRCHLNLYVRVCVFFFFFFFYVYRYHPSTWYRRCALAERSNGISEEPLKNGTGFLKLDSHTNFLEFANILNFPPMKWRNSKKPIETRSLLELWKKLFNRWGFQASFVSLASFTWFRINFLVAGDAFEI